VAFLFQAFRIEAHKRWIYGSLEAAFTVEAKDVDPAAFLAAALESTHNRDVSIEADWGTVTFRSHRFFSTVVRTSPYSADPMESAFRWEQQQIEWGGLYCDVEQPSEIMAGSFRSPPGLKWKCINPTAILKKSRGVSSPWNEAIKQVASGEIGFVYIAYPEGFREEIADARTKACPRNYGRGLAYLVHPSSCHGDQQGLPSCIA
jgi:hypothetical protein